MLLLDSKCERQESPIYFIVVPLSGDWETEYLEDE